MFFFLQSMTVDGNQPNSIGNAICMNVSKWPSYLVFMNRDAIGTVKLMIVNDG